MFTGWCFFLHINFVLRILTYACGKVTTTTLPIIMQDIGRKLWNDLRKEIRREGDGSEEEVQIEIPLAILLAKMEAS